jgi:adenylate cyclase
MTTSSSHRPEQTDRYRNEIQILDLGIRHEVEVLSKNPERVIGEPMINPPAQDDSEQPIRVQSEVVSPEDMMRNGQADLTSRGALTNNRRNFESFLAPLTKNKFREVMEDVNQKLQVVRDTLSMLDNLLDAQGFDAILDEMLRSITLKTGELLNADRSTIYLLDEEKNELWSILAKDEHGKNLEFRFPTTVGIAGEVATKREIVNIPYDFYNDPRSAAAREFDEKNHYRTYTMLSMPLLNEDGKLVAVVQLINKLKPEHDPNAALEEQIDMEGFTKVDERTFEEFAPSIRLIIESSRSFYRATQQQRAASALMKATKSLGQSSLDLEETLKKVMDEAKELMQADRSTLWLLDQERGQLWTKIPIGKEIKELRIPMNMASFAGQVAMTGDPLLIPFDLYNDPNSQTSRETDQRTNYRTCSMLCMPVFNADGDLIAVTQLVNKKKQGDYPPYDPANYPEVPDCWRASFNRNDQEFMQAFNIQAGVALQNAKLFETVKQQEQLQRDILRSLTNGVISTDKNGIIIAANESAKNLLGLKSSEVPEGQTVQELISLEKGDFQKWFALAVEGKDEKSRHQYYPDQILQSAKKEEQHSINLSVNTIADTNDSTKVSGVLVVMEDISDAKRLKSTMYRYMTQELAEQLLENPDAAKMGGDRKRVSVLFSDIRSYTTLTESMEAEDVVEMLNKYFETMVDAVFKYKGTLDKYIGDSIMAVFGSPLPLDDHEFMAVQAAVEMRQRLVAFNADRIACGQPEIHVGIGINSDEVISGNIGSSKRMEFTAIGDGVNLGSRLEGATKYYLTDIIISESTFLPCKDHIWARQLDYIKVRGKTKPVAIYEVVGLRSQPLSPEKEQIITHHNLGREYYINRDFPSAMAEFGRVLKLENTDKSAKVHLERCQHWLQNPPPDDWDGSTSLTEK